MIIQSIYKTHSVASRLITPCEREYFLLNSRYITEWKIRMDTIQSPWDYNGPHIARTPIYTLSIESELPG